MARYAYNALENALYYAMRDIDESRKTEIIYPLQKDILESTKDSKELMRSFLMDTDYTKDLDDVDEDSSNTLASLVLTKEKKVGYIIYIDLPVEKTFYTYMIAFIDKGKDDGNFSLGVIVTSRLNSKDATEIDSPETDLTGLSKKVYDVIESTLDEFFSLVGCTREPKTD
jgi:hypothetical protein